MLNSIYNVWGLVAGLLLVLIPQLNPVHNLPKKEAVKWAVQKTSTLCIQGSTNINNFACDITGYYQADTIYCSEENAVTKMVSLKGELEIDILKFDCHSKMLTSDLRKTLKATEYPRFVIRFLSLERTPVIRNDKDFLRGWVEITLGGTCRRFEICYTFIKAGSARVELNGKRSFNFADFNLTPPKKLAGLIKVKDRFNVNFDLVLVPVQ